MIFQRVSAVVFILSGILSGNAYAVANAALTDADSNLPTSDCIANDASASCECENNNISSTGDINAGIDCAWITASTGPMRPGTSLGPGFFQLKVEQPTPESVTPAALRYVLGYNIYRTSKEKTAAGLPRSITVVNKTGISIALRFLDGASVGVPYVGSQGTLDHRLVMVDAEGWATSTDPAYYDLYPGDGDMYRFVAAPSSPDYLQLALYRSNTGREETMATMDTEIVRDENEYIRQVLAPSCLADVVVSNAYKYSINFYFRGDVQSAKDSNGLYVANPGAQPIKILTIENPEPSSVSHIRVSDSAGGSAKVSDFAYSPASEEWVLTKGGGMLQNSIDRSWNDAMTSFVQDRKTKDSAGNIVSRKSYTFDLINGGYRLVSSVNDPSGEAETTSYARYTLASDGKKLGMVKCYRFFSDRIFGRILTV